LCARLCFLYTSASRSGLRIRVSGLNAGTLVTLYAVDGDSGFKKPKYGH